MARTPEEFADGLERVLAEMGPSKLRRFYLRPPLRDIGPIRFDGPIPFVDEAGGAAAIVDADGKPRDDLVAVPVWTPEDEKAWRDAGKPTEP